MSPASTPSTGAALVRARWATRLQFGVLGMLTGAWGAHIPSVMRHFALDEAQLALVLLVAGLGAIGALLVAGRVVARLGTPGTTRVAGVLMALALGLLLQLPGLALVWPLALAFGLGMSLFDVAINTEGSELEHQGGRALMSNLHALFSTGGMLGAACVALLLRAGVPPPQQLAGIAAVLALAALWGSRGMLAVHPVAAGPAGQVAAAHFAWPRGLLLVLGLLVLAGMIAEGVMYDWCVLYLQQELGLPADRAAWGFAAFRARWRWRASVVTPCANVSPNAFCWPPVQAWPRWPWRRCCWRPRRRWPSWASCSWVPAWRRWRRCSSMRPRACPASAAPQPSRRSPASATPAF
jgi:MFS family permease